MSGVSVGMRTEEKRAKAMKILLRTMDGNLIKMVLTAGNIRNAWDRLEEELILSQSRMNY